MSAMTKLARRGPSRIGVKRILIVHPLYAPMVVPMDVPAQASAALKSRGLVPVMIRLAMATAVGPRLTMWMGRAVLVVWTSCVPKDNVSGMSTMAGGDAAALGLDAAALGLGVPVAVAPGS